MRLLCGGRRLDVTVREDQRGLEVRVDGTPYLVSAREVAPGSFVLTSGERSFVFHCVRDGDVIHLAWRGTTYLAMLEREGARAVQRHAGGELETPMPGRVIKVSVAPGQQVEKGDEILVVEAMKMENAIRAPHGGRVKTIAAKVGDSVSPGILLAEIE